MAAASAAPLAVHTIGAAAEDATANNKINVGFIGTGTMGKGNMRYAMMQPDVRVAAVCDVYQPHLERAEQDARKAGHTPKSVTDFRDVLADPSIDAVCISTPDHWHAYMTVEACKAGKDVYVEKPACVCVEEGLKMVQAARKYDRVVQGGTMQRSGGYFRKAVEIVRSGILGDINFCRITQMGCQDKEGIGHYPDSEPLPGLDWDMWLGPAPERPFNQARWKPPGNNWATFRFFWDYAGGRLTDWGAHVLDILHYAFEDELMPSAVVALGGKFHFDDDTETPDTLGTVLEYPGFITSSDVVSSSTNAPLGRSASTAFHGSEATVVVNRGGCYLMPNKNSDVKSMAETDSKLKEMNRPHWRNFIDCIRSRERPTSDIETLVRTTIPLLLANLSYRLKLRLDWDEANSTVLQESVKEHLAARYRDPWTLEV